MTVETVGYVLHSRHYRESSAIVDVLSEDYGKISVLCRGIKKNKSQAYCLRPFALLQFALLDIKELSLLTNLDVLQKAFSLQADTLFAGMYLNELLYRVLLKHEPVKVIFNLYQNTLQSITTKESLSKALRLFEVALLAELGYAIDFYLDAAQETILADKHYLFDPQSGFVAVPYNAQRKHLFSGELIMSVREHQFELEETNRAAKKLSFLAFQPLLGHKPLETVQMYKQRKALIMEALH